MVAQALAAQGGLVLEMPGEPLATAPLPLPATVSLAADGRGGAADAGGGGSQLLQLPEVKYPDPTPAPAWNTVCMRGLRTWPSVLLRALVAPSCGRLAAAVPWTRAQAAAASCCSCPSVTPALLDLERRVER